MMDFSDVINDLKKLEGMRLNSIRPGAEIVLDSVDITQKKIIVKTDNSTVIFMADTNVVTVDENNFESDRIAYIENGRTYISADCLNFCK